LLGGLSTQSIRQSTTPPEDSQPATCICDFSAAILVEEMPSHGDSQPAISTIW
jgi:hypothetical protein